MIEIKNKIQFPSWENFIKHNFVRSIKTISYSVYDYDGEKLVAQCSWCYDSNSEKKHFPFSEEGYFEACKWIEEQRVLLIEQLI